MYGHRAALSNQGSQQSGTVHLGPHAAIQIHGRRLLVASPHPRYYVGHIWRSLVVVIVGVVVIAIVAFAVAEQALQVKDVAAGGESDDVTGFWGNGV